MQEVKLMKQVILFCIAMAGLSACGQQPVNNAVYPEHVGDIYYDSMTDDPSFKICDENKVLQYYNFGNGLMYAGEKIKIEEHFKEGLKSTKREKETGFVTIRFIVNCEGKSGRFRIQGMDIEYKDKVFDRSLSDQLLNLTKQLDGWGIGQMNDKPSDYYQYLTFKIEDGNLIEIMP